MSFNGNETEKAIGDSKNQFCYKKSILVLRNSIPFLDRLRQNQPQSIHGLIWPLAAFSGLQWRRDRKSDRRLKKSEEWVCSLEISLQHTFFHSEIKRQNEKVVPTPFLTERFVVQKSVYNLHAYKV